MNVYGKLAAARVALQETELKKSGKNKHLNFDYSELQDFLPSINMINKNLGLISIFSIGKEEAELVIVDTEADNNVTIIFSSPIAKATLQGKPSPIQELGSQHTYMRRYMYMLAYEITEADSVDADLGRQTTPEEKKAIEAEKKAEEAAKTKLTNELRESIRKLASEKKVPIANIEASTKIAFEKATFEQLEKIEKRLNLPVKNNVDSKYKETVSKEMKNVRV